MSTKKLEVGDVVFSKDPARPASMRNFVVLEVGETTVKISPLKDKTVGPYTVNKNAVSFMYSGGKTEENAKGKGAGIARLKEALSEARGPKLDTSGVSLSKDERPIDYGDCGTYLEVKYGKEKGQKYYEDMCGKSGADKGLHFVVGSKIAKEIKKMLQDLGEYSSNSDLRGVNYEDLKARWLAKAGKSS